MTEFFASVPFELRCERHMMADHVMTDHVMTDRVMTDAIATSAVADRNAPMPCARNAGRLVAACLVAVLLAIAVTSSFAARAQDLPAHLPTPQPGAPIIASADVATAPAVPPIGESRRLFFGFLEFDCDPDASGGVPGFGALPDSARIANR